MARGAACGVGLWPGGAGAVVAAGASISPVIPGCCSCGWVLATHGGAGP
jgi:hypothetical protein